MRCIGYRIMIAVILYPFFRIFDFSLESAGRGVDRLLTQLFLLLASLYTLELETYTRTETGIYTRDLTGLKSDRQRSSATCDSTRRRRAQRYRARHSVSSAHGAAKLVHTPTQPHGSCESREQTRDDAVTGVAHDVRW